MVDIAGEASFDYISLKMGEGVPALMESPSHPELSLGASSLETVNRLVCLKRREKPGLQKTPDLASVYAKGLPCS